MERTDKSSFFQFKEQRQKAPKIVFLCLPCKIYKIHLLYHFLLEYSKIIVDFMKYKTFEPSSHKVESRVAHYCDC